MKTSRRIGLFLATITLAFGETKTETNVVVRPLPITINSEGTDLAAGFASAFNRLRHVPFHVQLQRGDGKILVINDVKMVTSTGAALVLETGKGFIYLVNPKDVIWISDAPLITEKPTTSTTEPK